MKANRLLKENISGLLRARHYSQKDLAQWCHRTEGWLSAILRQEKRQIPTKYYDRIADFFALATYQLFQPGIAGAAERRRGIQRRGRPDRRISQRHAAVNRMDTDEVISGQSSRAARSHSLPAAEAQMQLDALRRELTGLSQRLAAIAAGTVDPGQDSALPRPLPAARPRKP
jgi:hypothetical protein